MTDYVAADEWHVPWSLPEREGQRVRKRQGTSATTPSDGGLNPALAPRPAPAAAATAAAEEEELEEIEEGQLSTTVPRCNLTL